MNKERRAQIEEIKQDLAAIQERIEAVTEAEQEAFDNMPEGLQASAKGEAIENAVTSLETASEMIEEALGALDEAKE